MIPILVLLLLSISIVSFSLYTGISPMPSSWQAKEAIANYLVTKKGSKKIYELGSGWGGLAFRVSKKNPGATLFAFEISPLPWLFSRCMKYLRRDLNTHIYLKNFYTQSLNDAQVVLCYLYPGAMKKLKSKFENELKPGSLVISNSFSIPGWLPIQTIRLNNFWKTEILIYLV